MKITKTTKTNINNASDRLLIEQNNTKLIFNFDVKNEENFTRNEPTTNEKKAPRFEFLKYNPDGTIDVNALCNEKENIFNILKNKNYTFDNDNRNCTTPDGIIYAFEDNSYQYFNINSDEEYYWSQNNEGFVVKKYAKGSKELVEIATDGKIKKIEIKTDNIHFMEQFDENGNIKFYQNLKNLNTISYINGKEFEIYQDGKINYPFINNLHNNLKNLKITNIKELQKDLSSLEFSIDKFQELYRQHTGNYLINDINNCSSISDKDKKTLYHILEPKYSKMKRYYVSLEKDNEQISNKHYIGNHFDIKYAGKYIEITNKDSEQTVTINLDKLLSKIEDEDSIYRIVVSLQNLPAEVLFDIGTEIKSIRVEKTKKDDNGLRAAGYYMPAADEIILDNNATTSNRVIAHETAHALDNIYTSGNSYFLTDSITEFEEIFEEELEQYLESGGEQFDLTNPPNIIEQIFKPDNYLTTNEQEAFARCYEVLMLGKKYKIIEQFPRTLEAAKCILQEIRQKPMDNRVNY